MFAAFLLTFMIVDSMAQIPGTGPCSGAQKPMSDFDVSKWLGYWYAYESYPQPYIPAGKCQQMEFVPNRDGSIKAGLKQIADTHREILVERFVYQLQNDGANFTVTGPETVPAYGQKFSVFSTDYTTYSIEGSCTNVGPSSLNEFYVMTRSGQPSTDVQMKINQTLEELQIPQEYFTLTDQKHCPLGF